jgi:hypothetical protein
LLLLNEYDNQVLREIGDDSQSGAFSAGEIIPNQQRVQLVKYSQSGACSAGELEVYTLVS